MKISRELFDQQRHPRFGNANPERMQLAFWEWMIRGEEMSPVNQDDSSEYDGMIMRNGYLKSAYGPWRARDLFKIPMNREEGPIWNFDRMGMTSTQLPDGRVVCVGGEHEDFYDPDFHIYNDVVVFGPGDEIEIYGYPKEVFPPTDFHTATLLDDRIIIIGCLGYLDDRRPGYTPVYSLDLREYRMSKIETSGEMPGWIYQHEADLDPEGMIIIRGGEMNEEDGDQVRTRRNIEEYGLDIRSWTWSRLTDRNWRQLSICQEDYGMWKVDPYLEFEHLLPLHIEHTVVPCEGRKRSQLAINGVIVSIIINLRDIEIIVEGELPAALTIQLAEELRANTEAAVQHRCILEQLSRRR